VTALLLDTSAYSAFKRGHSGIVDALRTAEEIHVNAIVLGELRACFRRGKHALRNERELSQFLASPRVVPQPVDEEASERYAVILDSLRTAGTPIPTNDIWIAATAMQHGLVLATTDAHYESVPQIIVRPFLSV
jgi:predicted nucleic acid-binding protein